MVPSQSRQPRAKGEAARQRILDAAVEIAGERGYDGTSISLISDRSGLPASSIYWQFRDKDDLIASVIERSFEHWIEVLREPLPDTEALSAEEFFRFMMRRTRDVLGHSGDLMRLGLTLILERRPEELTARTKFIEARRATTVRLHDFYRFTFAGLGSEDLDWLVTMTMSLTEGAFISHELGEIDFPATMDRVADAVVGEARRLGRAAEQAAAAGVGEGT